jgi:dihydrofolate reductase
MKTILIFVTTLDGKITKWGNPNIRSWSSADDQDYFDTIWNGTRIIIMGSLTYKTNPVKPVQKHHYIVLTRHPEKYKDKDIPGQLEFTDERPKKLITRLEKEGQKELLVVGGPQIATLFLKEQLIDELWLTLEPRIFGIGGNFVIEEKFDISLILLNSEKINDQGTLINKYRVIRKD